jgi:hypothetical protein
MNELSEPFHFERIAFTHRPATVMQGFCPASSR